MAFDHTRDFDGDMTISETESACEIEQRAGFQLGDIEFGTKTKDGQTFLINKGGFMRQLFDVLNDLHFVKISMGANEETVNRTKDDKTALGWTFISDSKIYERKQVTRVLIFGK